MNDRRVSGRVSREAPYQKQTTKEREPQLKRRNLPPFEVTPAPHRCDKRGRITKSRHRKHSRGGGQKLGVSKCPSDRDFIEEAGQGVLQALLPAPAGASGEAPNDPGNGSVDSMSVTVSSTDDDRQIKFSDGLHDADEAGAELEFETDGGIDDGMADSVTVSSAPSDTINSKYSDWSEAQASRTVSFPPPSIETYLREPQFFALNVAARAPSRDIYLHNQHGMATNIHLGSLDVTAMFPFWRTYRHRSLRGIRTPYSLRGLGKSTLIEDSGAGDRSARAAGPKSTS